MTIICCENCRYFKSNSEEDPCLTCSATQDRIEYWEPILDDADGWEDVNDGKET